MPFACAVLMIEQAIALASAPFDEVENNRFFLPMPKGFTSLSADLLSVGIFGSSKKHKDILIPIAIPNSV